MSPSRGDRGFALVAVLWVLVVVGSLGALFQSAARAERLGAAHARELSQARWAARAGLARGLSAIDRAIQSGQLAGESRNGGFVMPPLSIDLDGASVRVEFVDSRSRLNLNEADAEQLRSLLLALGAVPAEASRFADAVLDWRDPDDFRRQRGAERPDYARLDPPTQPKDGSFDQVSELRGVFGVTSRLFETVAPYLTVAGDGRVNVGTAPVPVLATLPGVDVEAAAAITRRNRATAIRNVYQLVEVLEDQGSYPGRFDAEALAERIAFNPRDLEVEVTSSVNASSLGTRLSAEVRLTGGGHWHVESVVER